MKFPKYLLPAACCLAVFACEKKPFDYRSKFLGDYDFAVHQTAWDLANGNWLDTNYTFAGEARYGSQKNSVVIYFAPGLSVEATLAKDGTLDSCFCGYNLYLAGGFPSKKELQFTFGQNGLGGGGEWEVSGEKN